MQDHASLYVFAQRSEMSCGCNFHRKVLMRLLEDDHKRAMMDALQFAALSGCKRGPGS